MELLRKFYIDQDSVTVTATDKFPSEAYLDKNLPYTQTGMDIINRQVRLALHFISRGTTYIPSIKKICPDHDNCEFYKKEI